MFKKTSSLMATLLLGIIAYSGIPSFAEASVVAEQAIESDRVSANHMADIMKSNSSDSSMDSEPASDVVEANAYD